MSADYEGSPGPDNEFGTYETMYGFAGDDSLGSDSAIVRIYGGSENDYLFHQYAGEAGRAYLYGEDGDDQLFGAAGDDKSYGGSGNDWLWGGAGKNVYWGGSGRDHFGFFELPDSQLDKIKDFKVKKDFLNFDPFYYSVGLAGDTLAKAQFRYGKAAKDGDDNFGYNKKTGIVWFDPDGKGGEAQVDVVKLDKDLAFSNLNIQF